MMDLEDRGTRLHQGYGAARQVTRDPSGQRRFFQCRGAAMSLSRRRAAAERTLSAKTKTRTPSATHSMCVIHASSRRIIRDAKSAFQNTANRRTQRQEEIGRPPDRIHRDKFRWPLHRRREKAIGPAVRGGCGGGNGRSCRRCSRRRRGAGRGIWWRRRRNLERRQSGDSSRPTRGMEKSGRSSGQKTPVRVRASHC